MNTSDVQSGDGNFIRSSNDFYCDVIFSRDFCITKYYSDVLILNPILAQPPLIFIDHKTVLWRTRSFRCVWLKVTHTTYLLQGYLLKPLISRLYEDILSVSHLYGWDLQSTHLNTHTCRYLAVRVTFYALLPTACRGELIHRCIDS